MPVYSSRLSKRLRQSDVTNRQDGGDVDGGGGGGEGLVGEGGVFLWPYTGKMTGDEY